MTLAEYLDRRSNGSISSLAGRVGVSRMTLYNIMKGSRARPSTAQGIVVATGGAVSLEDLAHAVVSSKRDGRAPAVATGAAL